MSIAVTGANGRLGTQLLSALAQPIPTQPPQHGLIGIVRKPSQGVDHGIEERIGDYACPDQMVSALAGVDTLVLVSAPVTAGVDRVTLHRNVLKAARGAGVRKVLYTSVIGNGQEHDTWYSATQEVNRVTEQDLKDSGLQWIICRNGLYLDLDLMHIRAASDRGIYSNNGGSGRCGYISISELAQAIATLAISDQHNGQSLNLIGETVTQAELVSMANTVFGMQVSYQQMSAEANVERLMAHPVIARRGLEVARMLTGCFQCISKGAFDVEPQFELAAGRPALPLAQQMRQLAAGQARSDSL